MWFHIKLKKNVNHILALTTFWLGGDTKKDIMKKLKDKHGWSKADIQWIKEEEPPFL
tara:strand:+ start:9231 stop:9401 length:171 start_codon:yes stop_codon:yes gene_type:complete